MVNVTRVQYPVGQGCFHSGCIDWQKGSHKSCFQYVYDCGSQVTNFECGSPLRDAIDSYASSSRGIDALFVSHLDRDHISGLDYLLTKAGVSVHTVFISHLSVVTLAADLIASEIEGAMSDSLVEASLNPERWFGQRGVNRIVRVRPAEPGEDVDPDAGGEDPPDGDEPRYSEISWEERIGDTGSGSSVEEHMESGQMVTLGREAECLDWILVPHVDPEQRDKSAKFCKEVVQTLGLRHIGQLTTERLVEALQDKDKRENDKIVLGECTKLKECYKRCFGNNHNRVSMSVYSGPKYISGSFRKYLRQSEEICDEKQVLWTMKEDNDAVAWIGTGDSDLKVNKVRLAWQRSYRSFLPNVSTLLLPHHGSKRNFHPELMNIPHLVWCIASARTGSKHHPSGCVVNSIRSKGKNFRHVSEQPCTLFRERTLAKQWN